MNNFTVKRVIYGCDLNLSRPHKYQNQCVKIEGYDCDDNYAIIGLDEVLTKGIGIIGPVGSGKTYLIKKMVEPLRAMEEAYSMVVVQAKDDFIDYYRECDLVLEQGGNSKRSVKWNVFRDILYDGYDSSLVELKVRDLIAHLFCDKKDQAQQFFVDGARELLFCVMMAYIEKGKISLRERAKLNNKGLKEFFLNYSEEDYKRLLEEGPQPGVLRMIMGDGDNLQALGVWGEVVTTVLNNFVDIFGEDGDFSIREFVHNKEGKTLFINYDPAYKDSQVKIYGSIINLMLNEAISQRAGKGSTIFICDELPAMGKTDLASAINIGRAKNLVCIIGFQSIPQIYSIYGEYDGNALLAGCCTKFYFKPNDPVSRKYIVDAMGTNIVEYMKLSPGGTGCKREEGNVVDDTELMKLKRGKCIVSMPEGDPFMFKIS